MGGLDQENSRVTHGATFPKAHVIIVITSCQALRMLPCRHFPGFPELCFIFNNFEIAFLNLT